MFFTALLSPRMTLASIYLACELMGEGQRKIIIVHPYFGEGVDPRNERWKKYLTLTAQVIENYWMVTDLIIFPGPRINKGRYVGTSEGENVRKAVQVILCERDKNREEKLNITLAGSTVLTTSWQKECSTPADIVAARDQVTLSLSKDGIPFSYDKHQIVLLCDTSHLIKSVLCVWLKIGVWPKFFMSRVVSFKEEMDQIFATAMFLLSCFIPFFHYWKMAYLYLFKGVARPVK